MKAMREMDGRSQVVRPRPSVLKKIHDLEGERGKIAAIEPRSGDFFLEDTLVAAVKRAREKYPGGTFYFIRIGYPTAHLHHGGPRRKKR